MKRKKPNGENSVKNLTKNSNLNGSEKNESKKIETENGIEKIGEKKFGAEGSNFLMKIANLLRIHPDFLLDLETNEPQFDFVLAISVSGLRFAASLIQLKVAIPELIIHFFPKIRPIYSNFYCQKKNFAIN